jgi:hypothetical protein
MNLLAYNRNSLSQLGWSSSARSGAVGSVRNTSKYYTTRNATVLLGCYRPAFPKLRLRSPSGCEVMKFLKNVHMFAELLLLHPALGFRVIYVVINRTCVHLHWFSFYVNSFFNMYFLNLTFAIPCIVI